jgi:outer membrane lipoprotein-sorting protein
MNQLVIQIKCINFHHYIYAWHESIERGYLNLSLYINLDLSDTKIVPIVIEFDYMSSSLSHHRLTIVFLSCLILSYASAEIPLDTDSLLERMESAYARVKDYQTNVEVRTYKTEGSFETQKFLYIFKKPKWIRLDFESPHSGMVLIYPDKNGKVGVQPPGVAHIFKFHLSSGNPLIMGAFGQRIDQTDLGLLIENISHSLTDQRRGLVEIEQDGCIRIRVLAVNHFQEGVVTLYRFSIDKDLWLPVKVEESMPDGQLERTITFQNLRINTGVPDSFFQMD